MSSWCPKEHVKENALPFLRVELALSRIMMRLGWVAIVRLVKVCNDHNGSERMFCYHGNKDMCHSQSSSVIEQCGSVSQLDPLHRPLSLGKQTILKRNFISMHAWSSAIFLYDFTVHIFFRNISRMQRPISKMSLSRVEYLAHWFKTSKDKEYERVQIRSSARICKTSRY